MARDQRHMDEDRVNEFFSGRGRVGILNVGNTCFVSSVLQMLSHCPSFMRAIIKYSRARDVRLPPKRDGIVRRLSDIFVKQYLDSTPSSPPCADAQRMVDPSALLRAFADSDACHAELRKQIVTKQQVDAQEFLIQMIDSIAKELDAPMTDEEFREWHPALACSAALNGSSAPMGVFMDRKWVDEHDRVVTEFSSATNSIVHGQLLREITCSTCKAKHPSSDVFSTLTIDLFTEHGLTTTGSVELADCMRRVFSGESLSGSGWRCDKCNSTPDSAHRTCTLWRAPEVLLVLIKRFDPLNRWHGKLTTRVGLAKHISLKAVCAPQSPAQAKEGGTEWGGTCYRLLSVVCHHGSANYGHYISYFRDTLNDEWFRCDDESVTSTAFKDIDPATTYILAYERFTPKGG